MNATKRKFHALLQGLNSPNPSPGPDQRRKKTADITAGATLTTSSLFSSSSQSRPPTTSTYSSSQVQKKRRMRFLDAEVDADANANAIASALPSLASIAALRRPLQTPAPAKPPEVASRYCPGDREQLLRRLASFQDITNWTPKPDRVSEVEWAKRGWICVGKERVRCALCHKELVVKFSRKEEGEKEVSILIASDVEEALVETYVDRIITSHQQDCLWKRRGCDDALIRISFSSTASALEALRQRYDELCSRRSFLPYEFNLRLPNELSIDLALEQLPDDFFTKPPPIDAAASSSPNRVALALALTGWQGLSNARIGAVPNTASCHTCQRRLGLWMFKSKEVDDDGQVLVPAAMDYLDPTHEHRFFCPWKSPQAQSRAGATGNDAQATACIYLLRMLQNESKLRNIYQGRTKDAKPLEALAATTKEETSDPRTPQQALPGPSSNPGERPPTADFDDAARDAKDKERWARLRKVKSLFDTKSSRKFKRPGTPKSVKATTPQKL